MRPFMMFLSPTSLRKSPSPLKVFLAKAAMAPQKNGFAATRVLISITVTGCSLACVT